MNDTILEQLIEKHRGLRPKTKNMYLMVIRQFLLFAGNSPAGWTSSAVDAWQDQLIERGIQPSTINTWMSVLFTVGKRYEAKDYGKNFARATDRLAVTREKTRAALKLGQVTAIVATTDAWTPTDIRDHAVIVVGVRSGLRVDGIAQLLLADIDGPRLTVTLKGGKRHSFIADDELVNALGHWIKYLAGRGIHDGHVFRSIRPRVDQPPDIGDSISTRGLYDVVTQRAERAKIDVHVHPHLFRYTFISWARAAGEPDWRIASVTGHAIAGANGPAAPMLGNYTTDMNANARPVGASLPSITRR